MALDEPCAGYIPWLISQLPGRRNLATAGAGVDGQAIIAGHRLAAQQGRLPDEDIFAVAAQRYGCEPDAVVPALGASNAMFLAVGALIGRGELIAVERPGYGPFEEIVRAHGARCTAVRRPRRSGYQVDLEDLRQALAAGARALFITNAHNPSGALLDDAQLCAIAQCCAEHGALLMIGEVYDPAAFSAHGRWFTRSAFGRLPNVLCFSSLAKVGGLGSERIGWVAAPPALAARIRRFRELILGDVLPASLATVAAATAGGLAALEMAFQDSVSRRQALVSSWLGESVADVTRFPWSPFVLLHFETARAAQRLCERLLQTSNILVVPGHFFGCSSAVRVGLGADQKQLEKGLVDLEGALRATASRERETS